MRVGDWIQVRSGGRFYPLDPRADEVFLSDIASALSKLCRYVGHCASFYSVAQHSVHVAELLPVGLRAYGLLHDAAEAYLGDISRPLKKHTWFRHRSLLSPVQEVEHKLDMVIFLRFGLAPPFPSEEIRALVKEADNRMLVTEARDLMAPLDPEWKKGLASYQPREALVCPLPPQQAEEMFLSACRECGL